MRALTSSFSARNIAVMPFPGEQLLTSDGPLLERQGCAARSVATASFRMACPRRTFAGVVSAMKSQARQQPFHGALPKRPGSDSLISYCGSVINGSTIVLTRPAP